MSDEKQELLDDIERRAIEATTVAECEELLKEIQNTPDLPDKFWLFGAVKSKIRVLEKGEKE